MKTIYFVRHGESEGNTGKVWSGNDTVLSAKGREQSEFMGQRAKNIMFDVLISSTMRRARETAEIIADATGHALILSDLFTERRRPTAIMNVPHSVETDAINAQWHQTMYISGVRELDGENFDDLTVRAREALQYVAQRDEDVLMIVTHGFFLRVLMATVVFGDELDGSMLKQFEGRFRMQNTGITVFRYDEEADPENPWSIWVWNDHAHLG